MFSLISSSPLSEVLAPQISPLEEFIFQWNSFATFFSQDGNQDKGLCKCRIESTNLSSKLSKMSDILIEEQADYVGEKGNNMSPALEFVLQNKVLETLSVLAQADTPLGICPRIMLFFIRLLNECKTDLIPHKCVNSSFNKLVIICGKVPAGPYESIEMVFLASLCEKIYRNPPFLNFFLTESFPLINSLLLLLCSPDSEISKRAGDSIIKLISLHSESADRVICEKTPFCSKIINQIIAHYTEIPRSLNPHEVEVAIYTFRNDSACHSSYTNSVRKFLCFLKWYIFFDMLIYHSKMDSMLTKTLLAQLKLEFLESSILPDLSGDGFKDELDAIDSIFLTTVLLSNCLRNTESFVLLNFISEFLTIPDQINLNIPDKHKNYYLINILLKRCNLVGMDFRDDNHKCKIIKLASVTLQLFEDILLRPSHNVIEYLVVRNLRKRQYLDAEQKDEVTGDKINFQYDFNHPNILSEVEVVAKEIVQLPNIKTAPNISIEKLNSILYFYKSLVPNELKFIPANENDDDLTYLREAIKGEQIFLTSCYVHWPANQMRNLSGQIADLDLSSKVDFCEGNFLKMIFDNLSAMLSLPYEINLQVFSLLAKLSLIPDEYINEYLLDSTILLNVSSRSLFGILHKLVEELQIVVKGINDLQQRLSFTKRSLLREVSNEDEERQQVNSDQIEHILQSLIVLDEFCKELASIILAKHKILTNCQGL